ncbi:putative aldouronate transport system permease protein [Anaerocolumna jejuensis DSM 15929]|uniref:Putative aldouronate transport system permease protein n=1 Tax=Anaerocolumna jejuensis DSM 15929 TaxID=1121322 RepID=A0A1M6Z7J2_9FIRM|nr:carbohydrate ABC transporter permease [Anaerocolumna jejuensis]SHL26390.1 putative aldouronate transport system permease protein [Anaerocolumna jejuensis DSM 15929]
MKSKESTKTQIFCHSVLVAILIIAVIPFLLLFMSSITDESSLIANGYSFFPKDISLNAYRYIWGSKAEIFRAYGITILVTFTGTFLHLTLASLLAYPLSLDNLPGKKFFTFYIVFTMLFSGGLVPQYLMWTGIFHIKNTIFAYILPRFMLSAMNVIIIRSFFKANIPSALYEAARIDGASEFKVFLTVVLPLGKPILVSMGVFAGLNYWNDWTNGLYYVNEKGLYGIQNLINMMITDVQFLSSNSVGSALIAEIPATTVRMAIAFIAMIPILIIFPFLQKYFQKGMTVGAVKG